MDHDEALQQRLTERYLLDELDADLRDQFEEHLFDCHDCALDVRAAAAFVEQSKVVLAESPSAPVRGSLPISPRTRFAWLRPAFAIPVLALLLAVIVYQNLVQLPHLEQAANRPLVLPYTSINVSTRGVVKTQIKAEPAGGFNLLLSIPPDPTYSAYTLQLFHPTGKLQWSLQIPGASPDDTRSIYIPGAGLEQGTYKLSVSGITSSGQSSNLGTYPVEVQIQK